MGVSRHTEYSQLSRDEVFLEVNAQRSSKLDAYRDTIRTGMDQFDVSGTVLLRELHWQGYQGGITILREYIRLLKVSLVRRATERFETLPERGEEGLGQVRLDSSRIGSTSVFTCKYGIYSRKRRVRPAFRARNRCTPPAALHLADR
ncbi:MAG: hypothetical protein OXR72_19415 [Gemmatimonadota bacterium]|nr:hypothetical protein [Gemmatimonadota bacterium]